MAHGHRHFQSSMSFTLLPANRDIGRHAFGPPAASSDRDHSHPPCRVEDQRPARRTAPPGIIKLVIFIDYLRCFVLRLLVQAVKLEVFNAADDPNQTLVSRLRVERGSVFSNTMILPICFLYITEPLNALTVLLNLSLGFSPRYYFFCPFSSPECGDWGLRVARRGSFQLSAPRPRKQRTRDTYQRSHSWRKYLQGRAAHAASTVGPSDLLDLRGFPQDVGCTYFG